MNTQTNNEMKCPKNSIHACEEDHYGNCYFCGRSMLSIPQITTKLPDIKPLNIGKEIGDVEIETTTKDWEEAIREEFKIFWLTYNEDERYDRIFADWWIVKLESTKQEERKKVLKEVDELVIYHSGVGQSIIYADRLLDYAKKSGIGLSE